MMSDYPTQYERAPDVLNFITKIPTVWDDSKAVSAEIGKRIVIARRKADTWYVGGMCGWDGAKVSIKLSDFLPDGEYFAELICDGVNADKIATDICKTSRRVKASDVIEIDMKSGGGFALKLSPAGK